MTPTLLKKVLQEAISAGVREIIPSTMGEPLLYPYFDIFIETLSASSTQLNLTTNGTFPGKGAEAWARVLLPITSDIKISINGITPTINEGIMVKADTTAVLENIRLVLKIRDEVRLNSEYYPTVTLQVTFMRRNLAGIKEVIEFAIANQVDRVKGHHLWVTYPQLNEDDLCSPVNQGLWDSFIDDIEPYRKHIKLENFSKLHERKVHVPESYQCPFLGKELWIDCYGSYNVCCAPSEQRKSLGDFGSIHEIEITDVFASDAYQALATHYRHQPLCQQCLLRKP